MEITNKSELSMDIGLLSGEMVTVKKESNTSITKNLSVNFSKVLTSATAYIIKGENVELTLKLTNREVLKINSIVLTASLNDAVFFVPGSVYVNDEPIEDADIIEGYALGDMETDVENIIKFTVSSNSSSTEEFATAQVSIAYNIQSDEATIEFNETSNSIDVEVIDVDLTIVNEVNKEYAVKGDTLHYITTITNGLISAKSNLQFINPIPEGTTFVEGSVKVDDIEQVEYDPATGFAVENLEVEAVIKVEFDVTVD